MRKVIVIVALALVVLVAAAPPPSPVKRVDLDHWHQLAATDFRPAWPTGIDHVLIARIPNPIGRSFQVSVTVNGVSPCSGSGVCRQ